MHPRFDGIADALAEGDPFVVIHRIMDPAVESGGSGLLRGFREVREAACAEPATRFRPVGEGARSERFGEEDGRRARHARVT